MPREMKRFVCRKLVLIDRRARLHSGRWTPRAFLQPWGLSHPAGDDSSGDDWWHSSGSRAPLCNLDPFQMSLPCTKGYMRLRSPGEHMEGLTF